MKNGRRVEKEDGMGVLVGGIALVLLGLLLAGFAGALSKEYNEELGVTFCCVVALIATGIGIALVFDHGSKHATQETINSPQFRAGAVYEKLSEIQIGEYYLAILKDSKENIAVYKSPKKLPDKFIASELNDAVPIGGLVELGVESKKEEQKTEDDKVEAEKEK